jgi:hypothetical protein
VNSEHERTEKNSVSRLSSHDEQLSHSNCNPNPKRSNDSAKAHTEQAVQYSTKKDGKKHYSLATVQKRFYYIMSESHLYRWKREMERQKGPLPLTRKTVHDRLYANITGPSKTNAMLMTATCVAGL